MLVPLSGILLPVMKYLERALQPWIAKGALSLPPGSKHMQFTSARDFIQKDLCNNADYEISKVTASMMFFHPQRLFFYYNQETQVLDLLIGAASSIPGQKTPEVCQLGIYRPCSAGAYPSRMKMLYALRGKRYPHRKSSPKPGKSF